MVSSTPCHRILLVDDAPSVREALRWALESEDDLCIVGEAATGAEALRLAADLRPDLVVLDLALPDCYGLALLPQLHALAPRPQVVVLTVESAPAVQAAAAALGSAGYLLKTRPPADLLDLLHRLLPPAAP